MFNRFFISSHSLPASLVRCFGPSTASSTNDRATQSKKGKKHKRKGAYDDDETVGVDEEGNYSDSESLAALSDSSYDTDLAASSDSDCSNPEYEPNVEIVGEDDEYDISVFSYDVDHPCVDIGLVFLDVKQCKSTLTQHAILNDYAFCIVKKDKKCFWAKCLGADKGCKWTFFCIYQQQEVPWMQGTLARIPMSPLYTDKNILSFAAG
jgi:hypothetical protein